MTSVAGMPITFTDPAQRGNTTSAAQSRPVNNVALGANTMFSGLAVSSHGCWCANTYGSWSSARLTRVGIWVWSPSDLNPHSWLE